MRSLERVYLTVFSLFLAVFILSAMFSKVTFADNPIELNKITKTIKEKNAQWSAKETHISKLATQDRKTRLGSNMPVPSGKEKILCIADTPLPAGKVTMRNIILDK